MLNTPSSAQPCSSSPMRRRSGSVESVVLPVPDRPKNTATRPSWATLAEQCMLSTPVSGRRSFMRVKIDFLISPPYLVPPMRISSLLRLSVTKPDELVPCVAGSASNVGACRMTALGSWVVISSGVAGMNMVRANSTCHALSLTRRSGRRCSGWAPANASSTNSSRPSLRWAARSARSTSLCAGSMGWLGPHHTRASEPGSLTVNLSLGERPVLGAVFTSSGPPSEMTPSSRRSACS